MSYPSLYVLERSVSVVWAYHRRHSNVTAEIAILPYAVPCRSEVSMRGKG